MAKPTQRLRSRSKSRSAKRALRVAAAAAAPSEAEPVRDERQLPGDIQMQVDVHVCLLDAMTDNFPIKRSDIGSDTVPSARPIGADAGAWGICLASFGEYLRQLRPVYAFYVHKPKYTAATIDSRFSDAVLFLKEAVLAQLLGEDK